MLDRMGILQAIILGAVQGATEFLPISSSGHLVLVPWLLNWPEPGLVFDTVVHWGTLVAVVVYFWDDLWELARAWLISLRERRVNSDPQRRLAWLILLGSIPAGLAGFLFQDFFEGLFGRPNWAAGFLLITGLLLVASEQWRHRHLGRGEASGTTSLPGSKGSNPLASSLPAWNLTVTGALFIGLAQALAIAPGISRSGATIAAGLLVGLSRRESARFSFLLATPVIFGAGAFKLLDLLGRGLAATQAATLIAGFSVAGLTGYLAIRFLMNYLQRHALHVFAVYCWVVGLMGLAVYWLR
ncbi:MAG: undecaprenyl-diphosphate phosphatase [Anaerolineae bacterium]